MESAQATFRRERGKTHHEDEDEVEAEVSVSFSCRAVRKEHETLIRVQIFSRAHGNIKANHQNEPITKRDSSGLTWHHHLDIFVWSLQATPPIKYQPHTCNAGFLSHGNKLHGAHFGT